MTKLELIQSIIKHRQAGAGMCNCSWPPLYCENLPELVDVAGDRSHEVRQASASHDVRQG
jgi:hypothetical protein